MLQTENRTAKAGQWALVRLLEGGGLAAMVMRREGGGQGPSAPRATLALPCRKWVTRLRASSTMLATASGTRQAKDQIRSHTGWGTHPPNPQEHPPQRTCQP